MLEASDVPRGRRRASVAGAATTVLSYLFPDRAERFDALTSGERPANVLARGRVLGARTVARARTDGSDAVFSGTGPSGPGLWVPTPPGFLPPLEPLAGTWRTWNISSGSALRPGPPTPFGTAAYAAEVREVLDVSRSLTSEQRRIADFWADGPGTVTPPGHWNLIALDLLRTAPVSARKAAFSSDNEAGLALGKRVAATAIEKYDVLPL
jgi:hypothetical protein